MEYYIYAGDRTGTRIRDALIGRARAGVKIRVLLDGVGSSLAKKFVKPLQDAGVELAFFHPVLWWMTPFIRPKLNMRSHRKIVVCDGMVGNQLQPIHRIQVAAIHCADRASRRSARG